MVIYNVPCNCTHHSPRFLEYNKTIPSIKYQIAEYQRDIFMRNTTASRRYSIARRNAEQRKIKWKLSLKNFEALIKTPCFYCNKFTTSGGGIDRLNNSLGYEPSNLVSCCGMCNKMRGESHVVAFLEKIRQIYKHKMRLLVKPARKNRRPLKKLKIVFTP